MSTYKDIDFLLTKNELSSEMNVKLDTNAVSQAIKNIVLTSQKEKLFMPGFGGNAYDLIFTTPSILEIELKKTQLFAVLAIYETRATITKIDIINSNLEYWLITISYYLKTNPGVTITTSITISTVSGGYFS